MAGTMPSYPLDCNHLVHLNEIIYIKQLSETLYIYTGPHTGGAGGQNPRTSQGLTSQGLSLTGTGKVEGGVYITPELYILPDYIYSAHERQGLIQGGGGLGGQNPRGPGL